jgi:dTDP-4-amino-4,6-dideoxygalactose transaminase
LIICAWLRRNTEAVATRNASWVLFLDADRVTEVLDAGRIEWRRWYGTGLHTQPAFCDCPAVELPETERLAHRLIGLPMAVDIEAASVMRVLEVICRAVKND